MSEENKNLPATKPQENKIPETILDKQQQPNLTWLYCLLTGAVTGFLGYQVGKQNGKQQAEKEMQEALEKDRKKTKELKKRLEQKNPTRYELE